MELEEADRLHHCRVCNGAVYDHYRERTEFCQCLFIGGTCDVEEINRAT